MTLSSSRVRPATSRPDTRVSLSKLELRHLSMSYDDGSSRIEALRNVSMIARPGELISIVGPSGCGKSTLLAIVAGLSEPDGGEILIEGIPTRRRLGMAALMPQKDLLLPWKTVLDNTTIGLEIRGVHRREARREALAHFPLFGLEGFEHRYPHTLSGGMRQRAALLRTILTHRDILLLDEPFGALDALTRAEMQQWLLDIRGSLNRTILFVTHDVEEAIYLSDRVYVMSRRPGTVVETLDIDLPARRAYDSTVTSSAFGVLKRRILDRLWEGKLAGRDTA
jgi:ABC-type nitrate/sulfonate/bicarbonate transport system ATPase subunit